MPAIEQELAQFEQPAVERVIKRANDLIEEVKLRVQQCDRDFAKLAPYTGRVRDTAWYNLVRSIVTCKDDVQVAWRHVMLVSVDTNKVLDFVEDAVSNVKTEHMCLVRSLDAEIGKYKWVHVEGNYVWGHAFICVTKEGNIKERWRVQQTINLNEDGKLISKFHYRKVAAYK